MKKRKKLRKTKKGYVLAEGEVTNHAHRTIDSITLYECADGTKEIETVNPFTITHEEHKEIKVEEPILFTSTVSFVKEYDHFKEEARKVVD